MKDNTKNMLISSWVYDKANPNKGKKKRKKNKNGLITLEIYNRTFKK